MKELTLNILKTDPAFQTDKYTPAATNALRLPNCFAGETKFITSEGIKTLEECVGKDIKVRGQDGEWKNATVNQFDPQPLYKVTFANGNSYYTTANHRWVTITS